VVSLANFINVFFIPELRKKVLFTLGILVLYRLGVHIPVIGVDVHGLQTMIAQKSIIGGLFKYIDLFSGGMLRQCTLFALGIMPYITASIMMQMLGMTVPALEQLLKEGEYGRKIVNQYTRYLAFGVSIIQSFALITALRAYNLILDPGIGFYFLFILSLATGSMLVMWLGEQISQFGLGNGSSMIIFAGIVANFPGYVASTTYAVQQGSLSVLLAVLILTVFITITACIVFLEKGERKIPVQYTRRIVGQRVYGGQSTYIPFKINTAGVMPVIFTSAVLNIPMFILGALSRYPFFASVAESFQYGGLLYSTFEFVLIIFFSFFYTALVFNPEELAQNIKKSGGFIPGIRPGRKTAEFFNHLLTRIGLVGAIYLACLALSPMILRTFITMPFMFSGTGLLIVVGVALETASQIESYLIENRYEGFLSSGRITVSRRSR
jgi:preprotein translocase subunit SecY